MQTQRENFLGTPLTLLFLAQPLVTPYKFLTCFQGHLSEMQRQELELTGDIGKHSQSKRNYEQNFAEMTLEF